MDNNSATPIVHNKQILTWANSHSKEEWLCCGKKNIAVKLYLNTFSD